MFTCRCGGLGVFRQSEVVCQTCGLVLFTVSVTTTISTSNLTPDAGAMWTTIREKIADESANDAKFLKALCITPLDE